MINNKIVIEKGKNCDPRKGYNYTYHKVQDNLILNFLATRENRSHD